MSACGTTIDRERHHDDAPITLTDPIGPFTGEHRFLSNFWACRVMLDGVMYPSVEHAYQAAKTDDIVARARICAAVSPGGAKHAGKSVHMRVGWEQAKMTVMARLLNEKFQDPKLRGKLLATRPRPLIELNYWGDRFWGVCRGQGENWLGKLLMFLRDGECPAADPGEFKKWLGKP